MLVLNPKIGDKIHIGEIILEVSRIKGKQVTFAIRAPDTVEVLREELLRPPHPLAKPLAD